MIVLKKKKRLNSISGEYLNLTEPKPKDLIHLESQIEGERSTCFHYSSYDGERSVVEWNQNGYCNAVSSNYLVQIESGKV